jgi:hypothetical protein
MTDGEIVGLALLAVSVTAAGLALVPLALRAVVRLFRRALTARAHGAARAVNLSMIRIRLQTIRNAESE